MKRTAQVLAAPVLGLVMMATAAPLPAFAQAPPSQEQKANEDLSKFDQFLQEKAVNGAAPDVANLQAWRTLPESQRREVARIALDERLAAVITGAISRAEAAQAFPALVMTEKVDRKVQPQARKGEVNALALYHVTATSTYDWSVLGVTLTKVKQTFTYETNASVVTKVFSCFHSSSNFAPTRSISGNTQAPYLSGGRGYCNTNWTITYRIEFGVTLSLGSRDAIQRLVVNGRDIESRSFVAI